MAYVREAPPATISGLIDHGSSNYSCGPYTNVPDEYQQKLLNLLNELEKETGNAYTMELRGLSCNCSMRIKPFDKRTQYVVCNMLAGYEALEGTYANVKEIKEKIQQLEYEGLHVASGGWKCPQCGCDQNYYGNGCCQGSCRLNNGCRYSHRSKWDGVEAYPDSQKIYQGGGGSISVLTPLGDLKVM